MLPVVVFGSTCDFTKDNSTGNNRTITCDNDNRTVTTFKTPGEQTVLNNSICTIKCTEELAVSVNPITKVLAGTGFNYPLYVSGERKCTATYKYEEYETKIRKLVDEYSKLTGTEKSTKANEITNYYLDKKACDNFKEKGTDEYNKYQLNSKVSIKMQVSNSETVVEDYIYKDLQDSTYNVEPIIDEVEYDACGFLESSKTCKEEDKTIASWTNSERIYGKYTFKDVYLEKYTGEVKTSPIEGKTCNAQDMHFTDFRLLSKPATGDMTGDTS